MTKDELVIALETGPYRLTAKRAWAFVSGIRVGAKGDCWEKEGHRDKNGYTSVSVGNRIVKSHRLVLSSILNRSLGQCFACHSCDNPPCCNPHHLWEGTPGENMDDKTAKGRGSFGEAVNTAKLSEEDVSNILRRAARGEMQLHIATSYNVSPGAVSCIVKRKSWKHVDAS